MSWFPRKTVVAPYDFSDDSFQAADVALSLVEEPSDLLIVHVVPVDAVEAPNLPLREQAPQEMAERFADARFAGAGLEVVYGDPGGEIVRFAEDNNADLIVLPSHGRTGVARMLIGSVAERVTRLAHCPVLVLRK